MHADPTLYTLPTEPGEGALRRAAIDLAARRDALSQALTRAEAEDANARRLLRFPRYTEGAPAELRQRIAELEGLVEWLDYRADMRGAW